MKEKSATILVAALLAATSCGATEFVEVFTPGEGGYPCIRIPVLTKMPSGKLLAFAECRYYTADGCFPKAGNSSVHDRDVCVKESNDLGKTWRGFRTLVKHGLQPTPVYSRSRGELVMQYGDLELYIWEIRSKDEGTTWTAPVKLPLPPSAVGPGPTIETTKVSPGRLVFVGYVGNYSYDNVWYSNGSDYVLSKSAPVATKGMGEATITELPSGILMANIRNPHLTPAKCRATSISHDGGETWSQPIFDPTLPDPMDQAALITLSNGKLLFTNDANTQNRTTGTLRVGRESSPGAVTWDSSILINEGGFAYSSPAELESPSAIGLLWETTGPQCINELGVSCRVVYSVITI